MGTSQTMTEPASKWFWVWLGALGLFLVAAGTGAWLRFGILTGFPWGLQYTNVRHAHSHLMYFGWVTPALMALIWVWLPRVTERPLSPSHHRQFRRIMGLVLLLAAAAYLSFLLYGYRPAQFGSVRLPLSTILASFNMLAWYAFIAVYWRASRGVVRKRPLRLWDAALAFMVLATLGAWGIALTVILGLQDPIVSAILTHLFLDTFSEGWFVLALLGVAYALAPQAAGRPWAARSESLLVMGLPVLFLLTMPVTSLPPFVRLIASLGGLMVGLGLWASVIVLWRHGDRSWRLPLAFLALKATTALAVTIPSLAIWAERSLLRVSYLHWLLLGFVTLGVAAAAQAAWGKFLVPGRRWLGLAVILLILSLIPLTALWPAAWHGLWTRQLAAAAALGPLLVALVMWGQGFRRYRKMQAVL